VNALSRREHQVLVLIGHGFTNADIAADLGTSERTVSTQAIAMYRKIGVRSRTQAALWAVAHGIVEVPPPPKWRATAAILVDSFVGEA
jgi:DNA-binding NarL/FixJ family response regulator